MNPFLFVVGQRMLAGLRGKEYTTISNLGSFSPFFPCFFLFRFSSLLFAPPSPHPLFPSSSFFLSLLPPHSSATSKYYTRQPCRVLLQATTQSVVSTILQPHLLPLHSNPPTPPSPPQQAPPNSRPNSHPPLLNMIPPH